MKNIKIVILALFICMLFINADCNKVEETPFEDGYLIEGRLIRSCTDNTPKKLHTFLFFDENDYKSKVEVKTDSNGYFKIKSKFMGRKLIMEELQGKGILNNIPGGKSLNLGNIAYDFSIAVKIKMLNFKKINTNDSLFLDFGLNDPLVKIKGPLSDGNLGQYNLKSVQYFNNIDSASHRINIYINSFNNVPQTKYALITPCGTTQEIIFE
jgi:hypothetical protein